MLEMATQGLGSGVHGSGHAFEVGKLVAEVVADEGANPGSQAVVVIGDYHQVFRCLPQELLEGLLGLGDRQVQIAQFEVESVHRLFEQDSGTEQAFVLFPHRWFATDGHLGQLQSLADQPAEEAV